MILIDMSLGPVITTIAISAQFVLSWASVSVLKSLCFTEEEAQQTKDCSKISAFSRE